MDYDDDMYVSDRKRRRAFLYGSFLLCLLGAALVSAAFGTQYWYQADVSNLDDVEWQGKFNTGLFKGKSTLVGLGSSTFIYYTVCSDGLCMYSCASTKQGREEHLQQVVDDTLNNNTTDSCIREEKTSVLRQAPQHFRQVSAEDGDAIPGRSGLLRLFSGRVGVADSTGHEEDPGYGARGVSGTDGLMSQSLWAGTIACLSLGLLFAVLGAVFAVVNTATTPVEAITGIPGLYIWNGLAALFELVAVICWAVQFSSNLTHNVLIVDSLGGWTTEGGEALGYSFWLVVVAVVVHCANCALIGFGTYEPKVKEKLQEPDKANNDILLY